MTQDRPSGSTPAEQIAAVKRVIEECEANGYDNFQDDPHTFGHLTSMRSVLATLEGMASPGENERAMEVIRRAAALIEKGDSPSPQPPTPEAYNFALAFFGHDPEDIGADELAVALDRFAAQRVTRLSTAVEHWRQEVGKLHSLVDRRTKERDEATSATDKARREACKAVCYWCRQGDEVEDKDGVLMHKHSTTGNAWVHCDAAEIRALTPQNPGDAEAQEGG